VTYFISGEDENKFKIENNNQLKLISQTPDYETQSTYKIDLVATDNFGNYAIHPLTFQVIDGNTHTVNYTHTIECNFQIVQFRQESIPILKHLGEYHASNVS